MLRSFSHVKAKSIDEAVKLLQVPGSVPHAGGTDLIGCMRDGVFPVSRVISLSGLAELRKIQVRSDGNVQIGALATLAEVSENDMLRKDYAALTDAAAAVGSPQIRAQGTLGGNLCQRPRCWYFRGDFHCLRKGGEMCFAAAGENQYHCIFGGDGCFIVHPSDTAAALLALDARVTIAGPTGTTSAPLESFFVLPAASVVKENILKPGEILTAITLPPPAAGRKSAYRKVRERASWDFALAGVAATLQIDNTVRSARLVFSGVAPVPWRSRDAEGALVGRPLDAATAAAAASAAVEAAHPLEHNVYKISLLRGLVEETLLSFLVTQ